MINIYVHWFLARLNISKKYNFGKGGGGREGGERKTKKSVSCSKLIDWINQNILREDI